MVGEIVERKLTLIARNGKRSSFPKGTAFN
jgi:hypothetical protein